VCYLGISRGRVGTFYLPVFTPVRITKILTNPFPLFYLLPNLKLPVLVLIWGLRAKKLESVFPHQEQFLEIHEAEAKLQQDWHNLEA
jgi:hypothetical protein